jgi:5-methylcytosine-specific restriction endonuclease McrA
MTREPNTCGCGCGTLIDTGGNGKRQYVDSRHRDRAYRARRTPRIGGVWAPILGSDPCAYCGGPAGEMDHIRALNDGGRHDIENIIPACRRCNAAKGDMPVLHFLLSRLPA